MTDQSLVKPVISLAGVSKSFGATHVLKEINLEVSAGEVVVLIGASGSGKSTVLRIMAGLETTDAGEVWVGDVPLAGLLHPAERVGLDPRQVGLERHPRGVRPADRGGAAEPDRGWCQRPSHGRAGDGARPGAGVVGNAVEVDVALT